MTKCAHCGVVLPSDWPTVTITEELSGQARTLTLCVPCQRALLGGGGDRGGSMTP